MSLFKRQKSRQEKITDIEFEAPTDTTQNSESGDTLGTLGDMPITGHLIELRTHLIRICVVVLIIFLVLVGFSRELYNLLSDPLVAQLPINSTMIATDITSMTPVLVLIQTIN